MGANIKVSSQNDDFKKGMREVFDSLKQVQKEMDLNVTKSNLFGNATQKLETKQNELQKVIKEQTNVFNKYKDGISKITKDIDKYKNRNSELEKSISQTENKLKESIKTTGENSKETKDLQKELSKLQREYTSNGKAIDRAERDINKFKIKMTETEKEILKNKKALNDTNEELKNIDTNPAQKAFDGLKGKFNDLQKSMKNKLKLGIAGIGTAMVATAKKAVDSADEMNNALDGLSAQTGTTGKDFDVMKSVLTDIYNDNFGESFEDIAQSMAQVSQQTSYTGDSLKDATEVALMMRDTFDFDVNESLRASTMLVNQFGISGEDAYNLIAQGAQSSLNKNDDLLDTINEYSNQFHDAGFSAEEMFNMLQNGAKAGGFSIDKMGDAIKEFTIRSKDGSDGTKQAFTDLGLSADGLSKKFAKGGKSGKEAFQQVNKKLFELKDPMKQNQIGVQLYGTMWEDLGVKGVKALNNLNGDIKKSKDALTQINDIKYNSFGQGLEDLKRKLTTSFFIPLGEQLIPKLEEFSKWINNNKDDLKKYAKELSNGLANAFKLLFDAMKLIIDNKELVIGALIAITTVKAGKGLINLKRDLTDIAGLFGRFNRNAPTVATAGNTVAETATNASGGFALFNGRFLATMGKFAPWALGIATVGAGIDAVNKGMKQDSIPTIDLFNKKLDENSNQFQVNMNKVQASQRRNIEFTKATKKNVGELMKNNDNFSKSLMEMYTNNTKVTNKHVKDMVKKYEKMGIDIKKGINKKYQDRLKATQKFIKDNKTLTDKEKKQMLKDLELSHQKELKSVDKNNKEIQKILQKASKDGRALKKQEVDQIMKLQNQQRTNGVKQLSTSEKEYKAIMSKIKDYGTRITAEQASKIIENAEKQRKGSIEKANDQYDKTVATIKNMRDNTHTITAEQADKMLQEAERQKEESINKANDHKEGVIKKINEMNSDVLEKIDTADGSIIDKWDNLARSMKPIKRTVTTIFKTIGKAVNKAWEGTLFDGNWDTNWTGTNNFRGGLTKLHDTPGGGGNWELYNLPGGSKIYNHDASEALVKETAKQVAQGVLQDYQGNNHGGININIENANMNSKEDISYFAKELDFLRKQENLGTGGAY